MSIKSYPYLEDIKINNKYINIFQCNGCFLAPMYCFCSLANATVYVLANENTYLIFPYKYFIPFLKS